MSVMPIRTARSLLGEPLKQYSWEVVIPGPPLFLLPYVVGPSMRARSASIPGLISQSFSTRFGPFEFTHVGKKSYPRRLSLRFEEGYNFPMIFMFNLWCDAAFDEGSAVGLPESLLKAHLWVRLLGPESEPAGLHLTQAMHVYSAFPIQVQDAPLSYESPGLVFLNVTFAYDYWRYELWPF